MPEPIAPSQPPKPRRRWLKICLWLAAGCVVLVVLAYFVATSSAFFKGVILPRVGRSLNAQITVANASIHPFSQIVLSDLKVQPNGQGTLTTAAEIRVNYHLRDILGGNIHVDEIELLSPTIELVENADGSHNWDPLVKASQSRPAAGNQNPLPAASAAETSKPLQIDLGKLTLSNARIHNLKNYDGSHSDSTDLTNLNLTLTGLKNGQTAKLDFSAVLDAADNPPAGTAGAMTASLQGSYSCSFSPDLKPESVSGDTSFTVSQATGALASFDTFGAALKCDVTPTEIKQLALNFQKAGTSLGELSVTGPFDPAKNEGKLDMALHGVDRRLLNFLGEKSGIDFGTTTVDGSTEIQLAKAGASITATGKFNAGKVQLTRAGQTTPTLDLSANYDLSVDRDAQSVTLRSLTLAGTQNGAPLLDAQLSSPMNLSWGSQANNLGDAAFNLNVTGLNLADWKPFLGNDAPTGTAGLKLKVSSHQGGQQIAFDLNSELANLACQLGSNHISQAGVTLTAQGQAAQFKKVSLDKCDLQVALQNQSVITASTTGSCDIPSGDADLQVKLQAALTRLLEALPQAGLNCSSGDVNLNVHVVQKQKQPTVTGELTLNQFNGEVGKSAFHDYGGKFNLDLASSPDQIQIKHLAGSFNQNGNSGGAFDLSGTFQPAHKSADVSLTLSGLNENTLRPVLEPMLAGKTLTSVALSGNVSAQYDPQKDSAVKASVQLSNLVVKDPRQQLPATPLAAGLQIDASLGKQSADVRQFQITLTPTARAANQFQFSGQVDFSDTNAIQGNLKLAADSLDLTLYYDLFAGTTAKAPTTATASPAPSTTTPAAQTEPPPVKLPLRNFTLAANVGQLYLHEVAITNFQTTVKIHNNRVLVNPFQLTLNGGPVNGTADLDLGVPGYNYNVTFNAQHLPLAPVINTFQPARAGQMGGILTASAQIKGAGITGASLQRNLSGQFDVAATNLNLAVVNLSDKSPWQLTIKTIVNAVATVPDLIRNINNPVGLITSGLQGVAGKGTLMNELQQSPIEFVSANGSVGDGKVNLQQTIVQSSAFQAGVTGQIKLAPVLTNSTLALPVTVSLSHAIADQLALGSVSTTNNGAYSQLPQFLTINGTLGNPKEKIDRMALAGTTIRAVGGALLNPTNSPVRGLLNQLLK